MHCRIRRNGCLCRATDSHEVRMLWFTHVYPVEACFSFKALIFMGLPSICSPSPVDVFQELLQSLRCILPDLVDKCEATNRPLMAFQALDKVDRETHAVFRKLGRILNLAVSGLTASLAQSPSRVTAPNAKNVNCEICGCRSFRSPVVLQNFRRQFRVSHFGALKLISYVFSEICTR